jgi:DNA repair exonuclease SbcCD ATPase subunit
VETQLRKRKTKMEAQVESWILKFDQDMGERQSEIEAVQEQYDAELAQLEELQKRFDALESEYNAIMEQRRIEVRAGRLPLNEVSRKSVSIPISHTHVALLQREKRQKEEEEMKRMVRAAMLVQAMWRAYRARKVGMPHGTPCAIHASMETNKTKPVRFLTESPRCLNPMLTDGLSSTLLLRRCERPQARRRRAAKRRSSPMRYPLFANYQINSVRTSKSTINP